MGRAAGARSADAASRRPLPAERAPLAGLPRRWRPRRSNPRASLLRCRPAPPLAVLPRAVAPLVAVLAAAPGRCGAWHSLRRTRPEPRRPPPSRTPSLLYGDRRERPSASDPSAKRSRGRFGASLCPALRPGARAPPVSPDAGRLPPARSRGDPLRPWRPRPRAPRRPCRPPLRSRRIGLRSRNAPTAPGCCRRQSPRNPPSPEPPGLSRCPGRPASVPRRRVRRLLLPFARGAVSGPAPEVSRSLASGPRRAASRRCRARAVARARTGGLTGGRPRGRLPAHGSLPAGPASRAPLEASSGRDPSAPAGGVVRARGGVPDLRGGLRDLETDLPADDRPDANGSGGRAARDSPRHA